MPRSKRRGRTFLRAVLSGVIKHRQGKENHQGRRKASVGSVSSTLMDADNASTRSVSVRSVSTTRVSTSKCFNKESVVILRRTEGSPKDLSVLTPPHI